MKCRYKLKQAHALNIYALQIITKMKSCNSPQEKKRSYHYNACPESNYKQITTCVKKAKNNW